MMGEEMRELSCLIKLKLETEENSNSEFYRKAKCRFFEGRSRMFRFSTSDVMERTCSILMSFNNIHIIKVMSVATNANSILFEPFDKTLDREEGMRGIFFAELDNSKVAMTNCFKENLKGIVSAFIEIRRKNILDICTDTLCQLPHMAIDKDKKIKLIITGSLTEQETNNQLVKLRECLHKFIKAICRNCGILNVNEEISILDDFCYILSSTRREFQGE